MTNTVSTSLMRELGRQIQRWRTERGMTQAELAEKARLSVVYITKLERGERLSPSFPALHRIARALRVKLRVSLER